MRKKEFKKLLSQINPDEALARGMFVRLSYEFLIEELIKQHPDPKAVFNDTIKKYPFSKVRITELANMLELDLI